MNKLIFFVDDDKMIINLLEYTFQSRQQYRVMTFNSGEDCIASLDYRPDIIVLDYMLSVADDKRFSGIETLERIKKSYADLPVIMLTGHGDDALEKLAGEKGAERYLTKDDYFIDTLVDVIEDCLN